MDAYEEWMEQAYRDLAAAKMNFTMNAYYVAAFLSQQAAEKALKALIIKETGKLRRIHDLVSLARDVGMPEEMVEMCAYLNPAYTATRYPDVASEIEEDEADDMISIAERVIEWVETRI